MDTALAEFKESAALLNAAANYLEAQKCQPAEQLVK